MGLLALSGCGSSSPSGNSPPPPPVQAPSVTCPASMTVASTGGPTVVTYPDPVVTGGTQPVTTKCTIPSGTPFPVGQNDVICTATDSASRQASCVFQVDVTFTPMLKGTRFLAFGDSITGGEVGAPMPLFTDTTMVYPADLMRLMTPRYTAQTLSMVNCGQYGELAVKQGENRLASVLQGGSCGPLIPASQPTLSTGFYDVLLLLEGTNDLNANTDIHKIRDALKSDIRRAKDAGVLQVFISTVPPLAGESAPAQNLNDLIRDLAASEGVILVDSYAALGGPAMTYIGADGIHPVAAGQQLMAQAFFAAIEANFEVPPGTVVSSAPRIRR